MWTVVKHLKGSLHIDIISVFTEMFILLSFLILLKEVDFPPVEMHN